jgi:23S rRNA (cytidine1920-2'-O)/16S rRNA (cytidine1409-2'-O)-methyltransferase
MVASREQAQQEVAAGRVLVGGAPADRASRQVTAGEPIRLVGDRPRFVGRGGEKLDAALERFGIDVAGHRCLDAGASTGGFTDCLLQRGASTVVAVDVGYGQLHERLRADPRVDSRERTNARSLTGDSLGGDVDTVVADLSFISLGVVLQALVGVVRPGGDLVLLVKPQFEAGRAEASRGRGVVREPTIWRRVLDEVRTAAAQAGAAMMAAMPSPLTGADGNVEFLAHCRRVDVFPVDDVDLDAVVAEAVSLHAAG